MEHPTVEEHLAEWASQSPTCVVSPSERRFIQDMRQAAMGGVGYGWMQSIIEVEWRSLHGSHAWGPRDALERLRKVEAERDALRAVAEAAERHIHRAEQPYSEQGTTYLKLEAAVKAWRSGHRKEPM